jgi:hypothetical protein
MELSKFFRHSRQEVQTSLTAQIASTVSGFVRIRGLDSLVKSKTAIVMRKNYEISITQDVDGLENRESVAAVVYLKDIESYNGFKNIQSDGLTRNDTLAHMATIHLADQTAKRLLEQFGLVGRKNGNPGQNRHRHL